MPFWRGAKSLHVWRDWHGSANCEANAHSDRRVRDVRPWGFPNLVGLGLLSVLRLCFSVSFSLFWVKLLTSREVSLPLESRFESRNVRILKVFERLCLSSAGLPSPDKLTWCVHHHNLGSWIGVTWHKTLDNPAVVFLNAFARKNPCLAPSQRTHNRVFKTRLEKKNMLSAS